MNRATLTTVGRSIDLSYPTNRAIALVSLVVMVGAALLRRLSGASWIQSALWSAQAGLSVFLAWALCRELDLDHDLSAFVAVGLALGGLFLWGLPRLSVVLWLMLVVRVVNRTMGLPAGILDSLGVLGLGIWFSLEGNWAYGVVTVAAFLLDSQLPTRAPRQLVFAILGVLGTATAAILGGALPGDGELSVLGGLIALAASVSFVPVIVESRDITSVGDETGRPLEPIRVQAAQVLTLIVGLETALLGGIPAFGSLMPLWAAVLGASFYWLYRTLIP
jgi:hypothetical protein